MHSRSMILCCMTRHYNFYIVLYFDNCRTQSLPLILFTFCHLCLVFHFQPLHSGPSLSVPASSDDHSNLHATVNLNPRIYLSADHSSLDADASPAAAAAAAAAAAVADISSREMRWLSAQRYISRLAC